MSVHGAACVGLAGLSSLPALLRSPPSALSPGAAVPSPRCQPYIPSPHSSVPSGTAIPTSCRCRRRWARQSSYSSSRCTVGWGQRWGHVCTAVIHPRCAQQPFLGKDSPGEPG